MPEVWVWDDPVVVVGNEMYDISVFLPAELAGSQQHLTLHIPVLHGQEHEVLSRSGQSLEAQVRWEVRAHGSPYDAWVTLSPAAFPFRVSGPAYVAVDRIDSVAKLDLDTPSAPAT